MLLEEARAALLDVVASELAKLRSWSATDELLGERERKCLETYARIVKLLEGGAPASEDKARAWTAEEIDRTLRGGEASLSVVREGPG